MVRKTPASTSDHREIASYVKSLTNHSYLSLYRIILVYLWYDIHFNIRADQYRQYVNTDAHNL